MSRAFQHLAMSAFALFGMGGSIVLACEAFDAGNMRGAGFAATLALAFFVGTLGLIVAAPTEHTN